MHQDSPESILNVFELASVLPVLKLMYEVRYDSSSHRCPIRGTWFYILLSIAVTFIYFMCSNTVTVIFIQIQTVNMAQVTLYLWMCLEVCYDLAVVNSQQRALPV